MSFAPEHLNLLACPACKGALTAFPQHLECPACQVRYPIEEGIPRMLIERAEALKSKSSTSPEASRLTD